MAIKKTLGPVSAKLISSLYELDKIIFTIEDIKILMNLKNSAVAKLIHDLRKREIIARLKYGKYIIIPQEVPADNSTYIGNWYIAAREIVKSPEYYISYYSAMEIHNMLTHPLTKVFISTPKQEYKKQRIAGNVTFEFIYINAKFIWGIQSSWVTKSEKVRVSDIERTIIDCLYCPEYCGGILEVAKGLWIQKEKINFDKLLNYALKFNKIITIKRLGYILESLNLKNDDYLNKLRTKINNKYYILDPLLDTKETYKNSWKCIANISPQEMKNIVST